MPETTTVRNSVQYYDPDVMSGSSFATPNRKEIKLRPTNICTQRRKIIPFIPLFSFLLADTITTVMTVQDISNKLNKKSKQGERIQFATILKAYVIDINVDKLGPRIISRRWYISFTFIFNTDRFHLVITLFHMLFSMFVAHYARESFLTTKTRA